MFLIQYWHTESPPPDVAALTQSVRKENPNFKYRLFNEKSAERFIAEHFTAREVAAFRACAVPAMQADYFRYCAVLTLGGVYADADIDCSTNLAPLVGAVHSAQFFYRPTLYTVTNSFFIVHSPGHPLVKFALEVTTENIERRRFENVWLATGPGVFSTLYGIHMCGSIGALLRHLKLGNTKWPREEMAEIVQVHARDRIAELVAHAQFSPYSILVPYLDQKHMPYKREAGHWKRWQGSIYR